MAEVNDSQYIQYIQGSHIQNKIIINFLNHKSRTVNYTSLIAHFILFNRIETSSNVLSIAFSSGNLP